MGKQLGSTLDLPQVATPATPVATRTLLYVKSDNKVYVQDSTGAETLVGPMSGSYEPTVTAGTTAQYYRGDKTWQTLNAAAVVNAMDLNTQQTITGLKLFQARARMGFNAAVVQTPLTPSVLELELSLQSMLTLGESAAASGNPTLTFYGTTAGARVGTAIRQVWVNGTKSFKWQTATADTAYGSETFSDALILTSAGNMQGPRDNTFFAWDDANRAGFAKRSGTNTRLAYASVPFGVGEFVGQTTIDTANAITDRLIFQPTTGNAAFSSQVTVPSLIASSGAASIRRVVEVRTMPPGVDAAVDIGTATFTNGAGTARISLAVETASYTIARVYELAVQYDQTGTNWKIVPWVNGTGPNPGLGNDFRLEARMTTSSLSLRIRNTAGSITANIAAVLDLSGDGLTWTASGAAATGQAPVTGYVTSSMQAYTLGVEGLVSAGSFSGSGAALTALNATSLASGTVPDTRLPARLLPLPSSNFSGDLNTLTSTGWYSTANTAANTPYAGYFNVQVLANTGGDGTTQIAYEVNAGLTVWMRQQQVGTWNPWRRIDPEFLRDAGNLTGTLADARMPARLLPQPSTTTADLNTATSSGWYGSSAGVAGNAPSAGWFAVLVLVFYNGTYSITQVAYEQFATGTSIWMRTRDNGTTWQAWRRIDPEFLKDRANHTGTQAESTVTNLVTDLAAKEPTLTAGSGTQYYRGDKTWQTLNAAAVANAMDLNTQQTITGLKLFQARARMGFNAAVVQTPLTTSALELELSAQSMITLGESAAGDANPAVTFYRTAAGARTGTALRELWASSNGPFKWQLSNSAAYGAEIYADLMTLTTAGVLQVATVNPTNPLAQAKTHASPDTDSATTALHHTIGTGANQAAAGATAVTTDTTQTITGAKTFSSPVTLSADPASALQASTKQYVDGRPAVTVCTSTTRPASPYQGQQIYETDTFRNKVWVGSAWVTTGSTRGERVEVTIVNAKVIAVASTAVRVNWETVVENTTTYADAVAVNNGDVIIQEDGRYNVSINVQWQGLAAGVGGTTLVSRTRGGVETLMISPTAMGGHTSAADGYTNQSGARTMRCLANDKLTTYVLSATVSAGLQVATSAQGSVGTFMTVDRLF